MKRQGETATLPAPVLSLAVFSSGSASNYSITYDKAPTGLTVNKATLTLTGDDRAAPDESLVNRSLRAATTAGCWPGVWAVVINRELDREAAIGVDPLDAIVRDTESGTFGEVWVVLKRGEVQKKVGAIA